MLIYFYFKTGKFLFFFVRQLFYGDVIFVVGATQHGGNADKQFTERIIVFFERGEFRLFFIVISFYDNPAKSFRFFTFSFLKKRRNFVKSIKHRFARKLTNRRIWCVRRGSNPDRRRRRPLWYPIPPRARCFSENETITKL